jgi:hypothetical protein
MEVIVAHRNPLSQQMVRRYLLLAVALATIFLTALLHDPEISSANGQNGAQPQSPTAPRDKDNQEAESSNVSWIEPKGGIFETKKCTGLKVIFPPGFYERRVNAHCDLAGNLFRAPTGWSSVGQPLYFGIWSGIGEVSELNQPIVMQIPVSQDMLDSLPDERFIDFNLCIWDENTPEWSCLPASLVADKMYVSATIDALYPTRAIKGWEGNSHIALFWQETSAPPEISADQTEVADANRFMLVYENDFETPGVDEWSIPWMSQSPSGRGFLGRFTAEPVQLQLTPGIPDHGRIRLTFDLYIIGSWDGNRSDRNLGPDRWKVAVAGGPTLLDTSFGNGSPSRSPYTQSYPGSYPRDQHPKRTGSVENNTLGFADASGNSPLQDSVYRLDLVFDHTGPDLVIEFTGLGLQGIEDESWGIDNIRVEALQ